MASAASIRSQLEVKLGARISSPFAIKLQPARELIPTGVATVDALLLGGVPRGSLTEITGEASAGKTGLAFAVIAQATRRGAACAWVDMQDALDPRSAAAYGVELDRLLWLRGGNGSLQEPPAQSLSQRESTSRKVPTGAMRSQHPRDGNRGMDEALSRFFRGENTGGVYAESSQAVPTALDKRSFELRCAESQPSRRNQEQVANDRLPPRRGEAVLSKPPVHRPNDLPRTPFVAATRPERSEVRLDQSLRATDLLLQAGGFSAIVLDLSGAGVQELTRIPLSTWYRFRLAAEQAQTALILLVDAATAKSCTALHLHCKRQTLDVEWSRGHETALFAGQSHSLVVERKRGEAALDPTLRKSVRNEQAPWATRALWAR